MVVVAVSLAFAGSFLAALRRGALGCILGIVFTPLYQAAAAVPAAAPTLAALATLVIILVR